ncbi:MAG: hypothetical protein HFE39_05015 [Clostridiales bacterium]|jgi:hypothetical protein|nr:hypothetical protein [Clostridiales bacterium]
MKKLAKRLTAGMVSVLLCASLAAVQAATIPGSKSDVSISASVELQKPLLIKDNENNTYTFVDEKDRKFIFNYLGPTNAFFIYEDELGRWLFVPRPTSMSGSTIRLEDREKGIAYYFDMDGAFIDIRNI